MNSLESHPLKLAGRWLQFSLRALLLLLTVIAIGLGWVVERARTRGRAVDEIIGSGGDVVYYVGELDPPIALGAAGREHFWDDLKRIPVGIHVPIEAEAALGPTVSQIDCIRDLTLISRDEFSRSQFEKGFENPEVARQVEKWRRRLPDVHLQVDYAHDSISR